MSEPELAYANDDFDLPRWQTQAHHHEQISSTAQQAHSIAQPSYLYSGAPPPPPPTAAQRLPSIHQSPTGPSRQPRIAQLLDDQHLVINSSPYLSPGHNQLARSASLGGSATTNTSSTSRGRRHHQADDLEGAFHSESQGISGLRQNSQSGAAQHHPSTSFYPSSVGYHSQTLPGTSPAVSTTTPPTGDYTEMYYNGSSGSHASKRSQNALDTNTTARTGRSPLHAVAGTTTLLDPYSQQAQYSPTTATFSYAPSDQRAQQSYHSHSRAHSLIKTEALTPPIASPYSPHGTMHSPSVYSSPYAMDTSSPHPTAQSQSHLTAHIPNRSASASTPNTPLSYNHPSQNPSSQYFSQDQPMLVEAPQKRRTSGLRRLRDARDLRPRVDNPPVGRRMDSTGVYLSVCSFPPKNGAIFN
jgi:dual specificity protein kinase YAK1